MYILDTDHMTLLERGGPSSVILVSRLRSVPRPEIATTIVTYEEQTRGWLAKTARDKGPALVRAYGYLRLHIDIYARINVLPYNASADNLFIALQSRKLRLGTQDIKIAAITMAHGAILLTRNLSDFHKVPELISQDWSV
ncbi:MAG: type II toxin-antitoxin system VapC family toxin [Capsulimonadaceae bacterium]